MSMAIRCDRCGEVFDWSEDNDWNGACFVFNGANHSVKDFSDNYDLCPVCAKELERWFEGKSSPKEKIEVKQIEADWIISDPKACGKSLFWYYDENSGKYIGIDNTAGEAWTEEFATKQECFDWLDGKEQE